MRLSAFIRDNQSNIIAEWESFARGLKPEAPAMGSLALRDHIHEILAFVASDLESSQTNDEQRAKSHGGKEKLLVDTAAETHSALRLAAGFNIDQMVSEYRALRASIIKLWRKDDADPSKLEMLDMVRFNESIDQELTESISHYTKAVAHSKDIFLGVLGHDIRTPLAAASMSAQLMPPGHSFSGVWLNGVILH